MKRLSLLALFPLLVLVLPAPAAPAPFYQWQSLVTGRYLCSAHNPGKGWVRHSGPYNNAACRTH
ncbi:TPA: hypothetical protein SLP05_002907 [Pseudomonas putida]|jgi:hypothetical protein|uniref:hypothetical protein n=1 Tax=Pseudomonas TaxID=286 RepID=UPI0006D3F58F|nr:MULTISPECIES: hypothetical protein [Pseudomonas]WPE25912.1 hypothetical protein PshuTeo1_16270 [Pseudomonas hunanensis]EKT4539230.1 hypothetical protein [Pseudomonas putida]MCE0902840.1 hypothetical protein [Pseudomonas alloputida]MCE0988364.1 hypothetical protein [Pseudomonas alloputida]MCE1057382.1 hypothetical protein [Pseudomonas alloputida]